MAAVDSSSPVSEPAYAGFWLRFWAFLFDVSLLGIVTAILNYAVWQAFGFSAAAFVLSLVQGGLTGQVGGALALLAVLLGSLLSTLATFFLTHLLGWLYYALFESSSKQATPGKWLLGLQVTDRMEIRPSFVRVSVRHFMKFAPLVPAALLLVLLPFSAGNRDAVSSLAKLAVLFVLLIPLLLAVCFGMAGWTGRKQALHDIIAGCCVARVRAVDGGKLFGVIVGILVFAVVSKAAIAGLRISRDVGVLAPLQTTLPPGVQSSGGQKSPGVSSAETAKQEEHSYPQLHVIGVAKGIPADGKEDPPSWQKCQDVGLDPASEECSRKYAGVYEEGIVQVSVTRTGGPLIIALMAYEPTTWKVHFQEGVKVEKLILAGNMPQKVEGIEKEIPVEVYTSEPSPCRNCYQDDDGFYGYDEDGNLRNAIRKLKELTGKVPTTFQGRSTGDAFFISDTTKLWQPKNPFVLR